jgi:hypothetical protein
MCGCGCGGVGERQLRLGSEAGEPAAGRVHTVDLTMVIFAKSTLGPYRVHFVDIARVRMTKSTLCTLGAANLPGVPTQRS